MKTVIHKESDRAHSPNPWDGEALKDHHGGPAASYSDGAGARALAKTRSNSSKQYDWRALPDEMRVGLGARVQGWPGTTIHLQ